MKTLTCNLSNRTLRVVKTTSKTGCVRRPEELCMPPTGGPTLALSAGKKAGLTPFPPPPPALTLTAGRQWNAQEQPLTRGNGPCIWVFNFRCAAKAGGLWRGGTKQEEEKYKMVWQEKKH